EVDQCEAKGGIDVRVGAVTRSALDTGGRRGVHGVPAPGPEDVGTVVLEAPVVNNKVTASGRPRTRTMSQSYVPLAKLRHTERKPVTWRVPELSDDPDEKQIVGTSSYCSGMGKSGPSEVRRKVIGDTTYRNIWVRAAGRCVLCSTYLLYARLHYHSAIAVCEYEHNNGTAHTAVYLTVHSDQTT